MGDTCLPGLQGYPVQVEGWTGYTDKAQLATQNDISLQFGPNEVPLKYDTATGNFNIVGQHTFIMGGTQYTVRAIRLAAPKQQGLKNFSADPIAELTIWGLASANQAVVATVAALVIPIHIRPEESPAGVGIFNLTRGDSTKLIRCIPMGNGVDVLRYMTCVENDTNKTTKIQVAYWPNGAAVTQEQRNLLPQRLAPWGIPPFLPYKFLTVFSLMTNGKGNRQYIIQDGLLKSYQANLSLSVSTTEFKNGFRLIQNFTQKPGATQELNAYKCVAINRTRDIKNGKLMLDPATGRRFDEEEADANAANEQESSEGYPPGKLFMTVCIILGVLLGIAVLAGILMGISYFLYTRKGADLPPTPEGVQKLANALGDAIGK
jgi:hypothetical protein